MTLTLQGRKLLSKVSLAPLAKAQEARERLSLQSPLHALPCLVFAVKSKLLHLLSPIPPSLLPFHILNLAAFLLQSWC
jgi:hypothetical protein